MKERYFWIEIGDIGHIVALKQGRKYKDVWMKYLGQDGFLNFYGCGLTVSDLDNIFIIPRSVRETEKMYMELK